MQYFDYSIMLRTARSGFPLPISYGTHKKYIVHSIPTVFKEFSIGNFIFAFVNM